MGDIRNVLETANWTRRQEALVGAAAREEVTEFNEMAASLDGDSLRKRVRDRGDAVVMAKVLNHGGECPQWVENLAEAILRRVARMKTERERGVVRHDPPEQGDRPPQADHS